MCCRNTYVKFCYILKREQKKFCVDLDVTMGLDLYPLRYAGQRLLRTTVEEPWFIGPYYIFGTTTTHLLTSCHGNSSLLYSAILPRARLMLCTFVLSDIIDLWQDKSTSQCFLMLNVAIETNTMCSATSAQQHCYSVVLIFFHFDPIVLSF